MTCVGLKAEEWGGCQGRVRVIRQAFFCIHHVVLAKGVSKIIKLFVTLTHTMDNCSSMATASWVCRACELEGERGVSEGVKGSQGQDTPMQHPAKNNGKSHL